MLCGRSRCDAQGLRRSRPDGTTRSPVAAARDDCSRESRAGVFLARPYDMDRNTVRDKLLGQHERIREGLAHCHLLAKRLGAGEAVNAELDVALDRLRADFDEHNRTETGLLLPLLLHESQGRGTRGTLLAERMLEEHAAEHATFWARLEGPLHEVAANMDGLIEEIDAHMAAEERTFLSPLILRDEELGQILASSERGSG
jgi:iron-sulfur cluster repair protein YtfE (RIC family)